MVALTAKIKKKLVFKITVSNSGIEVKVHEGKHKEFYFRVP